MMKRRTFIVSLAAGAALVGGGMIGFHTHLSSRNGAKRILSYQSLGEALKEIEQLKKAATQINLEGEWSLYQHLLHCTQSIQFSIQGFPSQKSPIFQQTVGKLAFNQFLEQGYMRHNRNEPIPDAPQLVTNGDIQTAFDGLIQSIQTFDAYTGALQPHFAYGQLSKNEYAKAHAMHLADHFAVMEY
jgi:hypothetical protein